MRTPIEEAAAAVGRDIEARLPALTTVMTDWFVEVIPEFRHDDSVRRLMVASTGANLATIVGLLVHRIPEEQIGVPAAAAEYARRFAQQDLSLEALLRAYRLGEHMFDQWAIEVLRREAPTGCDPLEVLALVSRRANRYIDQVIEGLIGIYDAERRRWTTRSGADLAARVRMVLETEPLSLAAARELLGIPVEGWHRAAVVWSPEPAGTGHDGTNHDDAALQAGARALGAASSRPPLTVLADSHTLWAWHSGPDVPPLDTALVRASLPPGLRVALGAPARGLEGFRSSLAEALLARDVAGTDEDRAAVTEFDDVALAALMTDRSADVRRWVDRVLGGLAGDDPALRPLRETLQVYLATGGSYTQAAAQLHMHKNTVLYRVRRAEEVRGRPLDDDRLAVEVALGIRRLLAGRLRPRAEEARAAVG